MPKAIYLRQVMSSSLVWDRIAFSDLTQRRSTEFFRKSRDITPELYKTRARQGLFRWCCAINSIEFQSYIPRIHDELCIWSLTPGSKMRWPTCRRGRGGWPTCRLAGLTCSLLHKKAFRNAAKSSSSNISNILLFKTRIYDISTQKNSI